MKAQEVRKSLSSSSFLALVAALFLGALNDNLYKTIVALSVLSDISGEKTGILYLALTGALFVLPYVLFSAHAGYISDRFAKSSVIKLIKTLEVIIMAFSVLFFYLGSTWGLLSCVFFMGLQSALFSPSKYGILPEMLELKDLSRANGYLSFWTVSGIIMGTGVAGFITGIESLNPGVVTFAVALTGLGAALCMKPLKPIRATRGIPLDPITPHVQYLREIWKSHGLLLAVFGILFFWSTGQLFQLNILLFAKEGLGVSDSQTSILLALIGAGIGCGSVFAGKVSEGNVELGLVPLGAVGIALTNFLLSISSNSYGAALILVFLLGFCGGIFIVPLQSYLQEYSPENKRGSYIAASNFITFSLMFAASMFFWFVTDYLGQTASMLFLLSAICTVIMSIFLLSQLPNLVARCANWMLLHSIYKMVKIGRENVPQSGGALIVCNHVSYADAQILLASLPRSIRFLIYTPIYQLPIIKQLVDTVNCIPISNEEGKRSITNALVQARAAIQDGELVGIFAEGGITRTGEMDRFRKGLETIMRDLEQPIIPAYLDGMWGSIFSYSDGKVFWKWPKRLPSPVKVIFGRPLPATSSASEVEEAVRNLKP